MTIPAGWYPDPDGSGGQRFWDGDDWTDQRIPAPIATPVTTPAPAPAPSTPPITFEPSPRAVQPPADTVGAAPAHAAPADERGRLIRNYGIGVAAGLAVLVATALWATFAGPGTRDFTLSPTITTSTAPTADTPTPQASGTDEVTLPTETPTQTAPLAQNQVVDAGLQFTVDSVEVVSNVTSPSNEYLTADAQGQFVVVHLSISNIAPETGYYMAAEQRITADGTAYEPDQPTSYFLGNIYEELAPGASMQTAVVFDIPAGSTPQLLELHGDALSPGSQLALG